VERRPIREKTLQIAGVVEALWLVFVTWSVHRHYGAGIGLAGEWDIKLLNIVAQWATPAIAILFVAWLIDQLVPDTAP
jgi:hypothetical protein